MAVGQGVLGAEALDVAGIDAVAARIEARELRRSVDHGEQLTDVLALHRTYSRADMALTTTAYLALLLSCSEHRAAWLLSDAQVLDRLGAIGDLAAGLVTVEQARVVIDLLGPLPDVGLACSLWLRLRDRLLADKEQAIVRAPARIRELLTRWLLAADAEGAAARRREAQQDAADVEVWNREEGLVDIALRGLTGPNAQACLARIDEQAQPLGVYDNRSLGQRRLDAATDLLTGRAALPFDVEAAGCPGGVRCRCPLGAQVPCGTQVMVHVALPAALDQSDEPAELVGHGPIDAGLLRQLLAADPLLHRVWVDPDTGTPVAIDEQTWQPGRDDPDALRAALLDLAGGPPPDGRHPIHPDDHPPDRPPAPDTPAARTPSAVRGVLRRPHLADAAGYRPGKKLLRLVRARAPRCEWPGCGRRASRPGKSLGCDVDHDLAWPAGPTCPCNLGPLCRRHHRIKQQGWTKRRQPDGSVRWTDPTGRSWTSPNQHHAVPPTRPLPLLPPPDPYAGLSPAEEERFFTDPADPSFDGAFTDMTMPDPTEPDDSQAHLATENLATLVDDPTTWHDWPDPIEPPAPRP
jgi:hypothetical protein